MADRRIEYLPIDNLVPALRNPKGHAGDAIRASIERRGYIEPIVIDERTGRMVAGHGRRETLLTLWRAHATPPDGIQVDGDGRWLVPVLRGWGSKSDAEAEAYLLDSNKLVEAGGWNQEDLARVIQDLQAAGAPPVGWTDQETRELLKLLAEAPADSGPDPDAFEVDPGVETTVKPGDLYRLGNHYLLCGDCTAADSVETLLGVLPEDRRQVDAVVTDPPYAIYGSATGISAEIADDKMVRPFFEAIMRICYRTLKWFGHAYLCCDWRSYASIWDAAKRASMSPKNAIVWDKGSQGLGSSYANCYEMVAFFAKLSHQTVMTSGQRRGQRQVHRPNLVRFPRVASSEREHNAAKPVALMEELITNSTDPGEVVLEPFCGSGTTLMAAERLGRVCLASEVEPRWVAVTLARYRRLFPGRAVELVRGQ